MSASNFNHYYYPPPNINTAYTNQQWNWENQPYLQNFNTSVPPPPLPSSLPPVPPVPPNPPTHINNHIPPPLPPRPHGFHNAQASRHFLPRARFNSNGPFFNGPQQNWSRTSYKRASLNSEDNSEPKSKTVKKKKKPLSQNVPSKKGWSMQDAEKALKIEKEYNKSFKNHSLIIKFPDLELNKEIVSKFHGAIQNVHFQQPSTARFCFVTLQESADADAVISALNKQRFGNGFLTAEYKKDREDDQNIGPNDIDPLTLYVGNLAQEITKEDMVKTFPKSRRIDIGYAKKMKYTRYAFVTFKNTNDSIEAFMQTHSTEMHSKSLIVRFRRLHGTVGMPGESKPQNPPKKDDEEHETSMETSLDVDSYAYQEDNSSIHSCETTILPIPLISSIHDMPSRHGIGITTIKEEPKSDDEDKKPFIEPATYESSFLARPPEDKVKLHRPIVQTGVKTEIKVEIKNENDKDKPAYSDSIESPSKDGFFEWINETRQKPKEEVEDWDYQCSYPEYNVYNGSEDDNDADDILDRSTDFDQLYKNMANHAKVISSLSENRSS